MKKLDGDVFEMLSGNYITTEDLLNLIRLQKQLVIEEKIYVTLEEAYNIWTRYSNDLAASYLFFPSKDKDILVYIRSCDYFTSFEDYVK